MSKVSFKTIGSYSIPESNDSFPCIKLPSGAERVIIKIRSIPHTEMVEVTTFPDMYDDNQVRVLRVKASTPIVRIHRVKAQVA